MISATSEVRHFILLPAKMNDMKGAICLLIALFVCGGCRQAEHNDVPVSKAAATPATTPAVPQNRTIIKAEGWKLPIALPEEKKKYYATTVQLEGRGLVKVLNRP